MILGIITVAATLSAMAAAFSEGFVGIGWLFAAVLSFFGVFLGLVLVAFLVLWISAKAVDMEKPQETDSKFYRFLANQTISTGIPLLGIRIKTKGLKKVPKDGRFLLVCNHINDLDPAVILNSFPKRQLAFISKRENSKKFIVGPLMHKILCQPINRENDREALKTILNCIRLLKEDKACIGVFPEGYVSLDGLLRPLKPGVFKIAQKAQVPVVVCTLKGTPQILKNARRFRPTRVDFHVVEVLPAQALQEVTTVQIAHQVYDLMAKDLGEDMVYREETENT